MHVTRGQTLSAALPALVFIHQVHGVLVDLFSLKFQIFDASDETKYLTPVQVFPVTVDTKQTVAIAGGDRLGLGRYAATGWTVAGTAPAGSYEVRWFFQATSTDAEVTVRQPFEVLAAGIVPLDVPLYASVAALRSEGVSATQASEARALAALIRASRFIERMTERQFRPQHKTMTLDGTGGNAMVLGEALIGIESLNFSTSPLFPSDLTVEPDFFRAYNRHLQGLTSPDDRDAPRIEMFRSSEDLSGLRPFTFSHLIFPRGHHNVEVKGVFGYTDADGSPMGQTPDDIRTTTVLLALRMLPKMTSCDRDDILNAYRIQTESTRDQSYTLAPLKDSHRVGRITGDPEIDFVLMRYKRPPVLGVA